MSHRRGEHPNSLANLLPPEPGNQRARKHGGYARHFPPEVVEVASASDPGESVGRLEELIELERLRLHSTLAAKARWDAGAEYDELNASDMQLASIDTDAQGTTIRRRRPDFDQAVDRAVGRLLTLIAERERIDATPAHVSARLTQVLDAADAAGLTSVATAEQVERAGLAVPFSLQQRVRSELALAEPEEPDTGLTDDELERLSEEYEEEVAHEGEWLEERREAVQEIHDTSDKERSGQ